MYILDSFHPIISLSYYYLYYYYYVYYDYRTHHIQSNLALGLGVEGPQAGRAAGSQMGPFHQITTLR
jgi:hypothetical protein